MKKWSKRILYPLLFIAWLLIMCLPITMVALARNGSMQVGKEDRTHLRLFMVQEDRDNGVGMAFTRATGDSCQRTSLVYLMWEGEGENSSYCQCYDSTGGVVDNNSCP
jgi:hypothetical protein